MRDRARGGLAVLLFAAGSAVAEDDAQALARLRSEMDALIAHNRTCSNVVHCRVLAVGVDACGNPREYLAFNNLRDVRGELEIRIAEFNFIEEEQHRGTTRSPACERVVAPKPACINNRCALGSENY